MRPLEEEGRAFVIRMREARPVEHGRRGSGFRRGTSQHARDAAQGIFGMAELRFSIPSRKESLRSSTAHLEV